jgi:hypothetical protein
MDRLIVRDDLQHRRKAMGMKLVRFYERVGQELGFEGRMKLAMLTKIPSTQAQAADDSPNNLALFEQSLAQLRNDPGKR